MKEWESDRIKRESKEAKEALKKFGLGFLIIFALVGYLCHAYYQDEKRIALKEKARAVERLSRLQEPPPIEKPRPTLHAEIRHTGTQFIITNLDNFDWTDVYLKINPGLISSGYMLVVEKMQAGGVYTVGVAQFTKGDGTRFNPFRIKVLNIHICADTPSGRACISRSAS